MREIIVGKRGSHIKFSPPGAIRKAANFNAHEHNSGLISGRITISIGPEIQVATSAPTVNGRAISAADLNGLTEITIPLAVSVDTPSEITAFVPFYDVDGRFIGAGSVTQTVKRDTASVTVPVTDDVSEAASVKVMICGALRPASPSNSCPIA